MDVIAQMVNFMGKAYGKNCEVALTDLRNKPGRIIAIANGHISGRAIGSPITDLSQKMINQGIWKTQDYVCNHVGKTPDNRILHSSTFFIKTEGNLLGMLSLNVDASRYVRLSEDILHLVGLTSAAPPETRQKENFPDNLESLLEDSIKSVQVEIGITDISKQQYTQEERIRIIQRLLEQGVFLLRGAVSLVAEKLNCSDASLYRYISVINKRKAHEKDI